MSFTFTPLSDEELNKMDLLDPGIYNFEVIKSERKQSKSGNPMAALQLKVWSNDGKVHIIFDYLVFSAVNLNIKKVSHFCKGVGLHKEYDKGDIPEDLTSYCGKVSIDIQDEMPKPTGGFYPKKNVVIDYIKEEENKEKDFDDNIPF